MPTSCTTTSFRSQHTTKTSTLPRKPKTTNNDLLSRRNSFIDLKHAQSTIDLSNIPGITRQQQQQILSICNNLSNNNHSFTLQRAPPTTTANTKTNTMDSQYMANLSNPTNPTPKSNIFTRTLKKSTMRVKERFMGQFTRQHDRTSDEQFNELVGKISHQHQLALRFAKELRCYALGVKALAYAGKSLNEVVCGNDDGSGTGNVLDDIVWPKGDKQFTAATYAMETHWAEYSESLNNTLLQNVQMYLDQFPDLQARIAKRHRKLLDFDGARHELTALESAKKQDDAKINRAYEQLNIAKIAYEDINEELRQLLPRVRDARIMFYSKTLRDFTQIERKFHTKVISCYTDVLPALNQLVEDVHTGQYGVSHPTLPRRTSAPEILKVEPKKPNSLYPKVDTYEHDFDSSDEVNTITHSDDHNSSEDSMTTTDDTLRNSDDDFSDDMSDTCTNSTQPKSSRKQMKKIASAVPFAKTLREKASGLLSSAGTSVKSGKSMRKSKTLSVIELSPSPKHDSGNNSEEEISEEVGRKLATRHHVYENDHDLPLTQQIEQNSIKSLRRLAEDECSMTLTTPTLSSSGSEKSGSRRHSMVVRAAPPPPPLPVPPELPQKKAINRKRSFVKKTSVSTNASCSVKSAATAPAGSGVAPPPPPMPENLKKSASYTKSSSSVSASRKGAGAASDMFVTLVEQLKNRKLMYRVQATHAHKAEKNDELSFEKGDLIYVVEPNADEKQDAGWQMGIKAATGQMGLFPESFTRVLLGSAA